ncbi:MAG: cytochrome c [Myxococcales bacterium]|nr:cytochrome c [Myxococcales bacterium]
MRKALRWLGRVVGLIVLALVLAVGAVYALSAHRMARTYEVHRPVPPEATGPAAVERGHHVATIRGCNDCHGADLGGRTFIDDPLIARLSGANLTSGGAGGKLSDEDIVCAIRDAVAPDGRPLLFMPSTEFGHLSESDTADLLAYIRSVPAVQRALPPNRVGPLGRLLFLTGKLPLLPAELVDHTAALPSEPAPGPTAAYGAYLASSCAGCHGAGFSGGHIPGTPPDWPDAANLTPGPGGIGDWSEAQFVTLLRTGHRPDGSSVDTKYMPIALTRHLTDVEVSALYAYLRTLPARASGQH